MKSWFMSFLFGALLMSGKTNPDPVTLKQIGKKNLLFDIRAFEHFNGILYTVDYLLSLNKTSLETGEDSRLGNVSYKNAKFFFAMNRKLYIIENDGSMNEIDPETGVWKSAAVMGVWSKIERAFVVRNSLYTIENGALYFHRGMNADNREQRGGAAFYNVGILIRGESSLYSLQGEGSLWEINLSNGEWKRIGKGKAWKNLVAAEVLGGKLYSIDRAGNFAETLLSDGTMKILDATQFTNAKALFTEGGKLYLIMTDGNLYEVGLGTGA